MKLTDDEIQIKESFQNKGINLTDKEVRIQRYGERFMDIAAFLFAVGVVIGFWFILTHAINLPSQ